MIMLDFLNGNYNLYIQPIEWNNSDKMSNTIKFMLPKINCLADFIP